MKITRYSIMAWLQIFLLFFALVPRELFHEVMECNDTNHCTENSDVSGLIISERHHHCELMQLDAPLPFNVQESEELLLPASFHATLINIEYITVDRTFFYNSSRAPPVC